MKKILVPTDFSETSTNAVRYAAEIASRIKADILLFNVYNVPVAPTEVPIIFPIEDFERNSREGLIRLKKELEKDFSGKFTVEYQNKLGYPVEDIIECARTENVDLIIMGMQGAGPLEEKLIGSITTAVLRKVKCPVLAIDKKVRFRDIKRIVLANDMNEIPDRSILNPLKYIARSFDSHIFILNVVPAEHLVTAENEAAAGIMLDHSLEDINHSFHFFHDDNVAEGITEFVNENFMDMVVMIPRKHSFLWNMFHESNSKRMAFHSDVPLLTLHE